MDKYGVLSGYEDGLDEDDDEGSRAIPSRTNLGSESAFIEKYPGFGGYRWGIRNFAYRCQLTIPQIEIMGADTPHTLYRRRKDNGKVSQADVDDATRKTLESAKRKKEEREKKREYTIEEVFEGKADMEQEENET